MIIQLDLDESGEKILKNLMDSTGKLTPKDFFNHAIFVVANQEKEKREANMLQKLASVDSVVQTLMEEGYFNSAFFIAKKFGVLCGTINSILMEYMAKRKTISELSNPVTLPPESLILEFAKLGADKRILEQLHKYIDDLPV